MGQLGFWRHQPLPQQLGRLEGKDVRGDDHSAAVGVLELAPLVPGGGSFMACFGDQQLVSSAEHSAGTRQKASSLGTAILVWVLKPEAKELGFVGVKVSTFLTASNLAAAHAGSELCSKFSAKDVSEGL
jgi:hypothetical protein